MKMDVSLLKCTCGKSHWVRNGKIVGNVDPYDNADLGIVNSLNEVI